MQGRTFETEGILNGITISRYRQAILFYVGNHQMFMQYRQLPEWFKNGARIRATMVNGKFNFEHLAG